MFQGRNQAARCRARGESVSRDCTACGPVCTGEAGIAVAADGKALFEAKCGACHSVGGGPKVGPDLKGVVARRGKEWTILAIVDPAKAGLGPSMPGSG